MDSRKYDGKAKDNEKVTAGMGGQESSKSLTESNRSTAHDLSQTAPSKVNSNPSHEKGFQHNQATNIDPFPKLQAFKKLVDLFDPDFKREHPELAKGGPEFINHLHLHQDLILDEMQKKLINFDGEEKIDFDINAIPLILFELKSRPNGKLIYQERKVLKDLYDPQLDPELPLCILSFDVSNDRTKAEINNFFSFKTKKVAYPVSSEREFKGVRLEDTRAKLNSISLRSIECGFVSDSSRVNDKDDRYERLEYIHLIYTIPCARTNLYNN